MNEDFGERVGFLGNARKAELLNARNHATAVLSTLQGRYAQLDLHGYVESEPDGVRIQFKIKTTKGLFGQGYEFVALYLDHSWVCRVESGGDYAAAPDLGKALTRYLLNRLDPLEQLAAVVDL